MRKVTFHEDAETEMKEAARYYEERALDLGMSFLYAVEEAVEQVLANPEAYQLVGDEVRHKILKRFPYSVLYVIEPDRVRVMAIAHQKRHNT
ncbi:MAG: type II toxin-antitoxin system RelE/ParE family toxin [Syntrophales bacterium]|nr:type II toxin-antitoxin system RelE/ParE family toxin [Syntrophales bacterium]